MLIFTRIRQIPPFVAIAAIGAVAAFSGVSTSPTKAQAFVGNDGHFSWKSDYCEGVEDCKIEVKVVDGERIVIVNGDTVETGEMGNLSKMLLRHRPMFDRLLTDRVVWHEPGDDALVWLGGDFEELGLFDRPHARVGRHMRFHNDHTLRKMERDASNLARKARLADDDEEAELKVELDQKLSEIFDYKNGKRLEAIETAEKRLDEMRARQSKRESSRTEIIEQRKQELLGEESYLEW